METMLTRLVEFYGWKELFKKVEIRCFMNNPSIKSSLKFLRKTEWARVKIEKMFLELENKRNK